MRADDYRHAGLPVRGCVFSPSACWADRYGRRLATDTRPGFLLDHGRCSRGLAAQLHRASFCCGRCSAFGMAANGALAPSLAMENGAGPAARIALGKFLQQGYAMGLYHCLSGRVLFLRVPRRWLEAPVLPGGLPACWQYSCSRRVKESEVMKKTRTS